MRIYILDDCEILRMSLSLVLQREDEIQVVGQSGSEGDICAKILQSDCCTLLIGLRPPNACEFELTRRLRSHGAKICILALGYSSKAADFQEMFQAGIDGFLSMSSKNDVIAAKILSTRRIQSFAEFSVTDSSYELRLCS